MASIANGDGTTPNVLQQYNNVQCCTDGSFNVPVTKKNAPNLKQYVKCSIYKTEAYDSER